MCTSTIRLDPASAHLESDIADAIRSVLGEDDTKWGVTVLYDADSGNWNIGAQPGDDQPFHGVLTNNGQSAEAVRNMIFSFLQQYKDWTADNE